ncbi:MAG: hypothetical protein ABI577_12850 [bacterium]
MDQQSLKRTVCAWCEQVISEAQGVGGDGTVSHGICIDCLGEQFKVPLVSVLDLAAEEADRLPYGRIVLDAANCVIAYNRAEADLSHRLPSAVLGKNFFTGVAPCTNVQALAGWVAQARLKGRPDRTETDFVFEFPFGRAFVHMALIYDRESDRTSILVEKTAEDSSTSRSRTAGGTLH